MREKQRTSPRDRAFDLHQKEIPYFVATYSRGLTRGTDYRPRYRRTENEAN